MADTKTKTTNTTETPGRVAELEAIAEDLTAQLAAATAKMTELEDLVELLRGKLELAESQSRGGFELNGFQPVPKSPEIDGQALVEFTHIKGNGQLLYAERTALLGEAGWSPKLIANLLTGMAQRCVSPGVFGNPLGRTPEEQMSFCPPFSVKRKLGVAIWIE